MSKIIESIQMVNQRDMHGLCCCCLELWSVKTMWTEYTWMKNTEVYGDMLKECFHFDWPWRGHKDRICGVCITHLRSAALFRRRVLDSQAKLSTQNVDLLKRDEETFGNLEDGHQNDDDFDNDAKDEIIEYDNPPKKHLKNRTIRRNRTRLKLSTKRKDTTGKSKPTKRSDNFIRPRQNASLILENSTIVPFKSNKGYFNCFYCNKQYASFDELKSHSNKHKNMTFRTISKSILRPHDKIRADVSDIYCKICNTKIVNLIELTKHLSDHHNVKFISDDDNKPEQCILPYKLSDGKFVCYVCNNEFLFLKTLSKHMNEHSSDYVCDVCGRCFLLLERLRAHSALHITNSVKCQFCDKVYTSKILLRSHIRYTHKKISFLCSICDQTFPNIRARLKHLEDMHNRKPLDLNCKICQKGFLTPNTLNSHIRLEHMKINKEYKFECTECKMMFKSRHALNYHGTVHSGVKNFECEVCHKKFARSKSLAEHLKIHLNDKRWRCGGCQMCFVQKCSLKNHIRVHHTGCMVDDLIVYKKPGK